MHIWVRGDGFLDSWNSQSRPAKRIKIHLTGGPDHSKLIAAYM